MTAEVFVVNGVGLSITRCMISFVSFRRSFAASLIELRRMRLNFFGAARRRRSSILVSIVTLMTVSPGRHIHRHRRSMSGKVGGRRGGRL